MKWYNNTDEIQPINPREFGGFQTSRPSLVTPSAPALAAPKERRFNIDTDSLTSILTTGAMVAGTIGGQRAASGAAAQRQARVAACGRKGVGFFLSRRKREEYRRCVEAANAASYGGGSDKSMMPPPPPPQKSNTLLFVGIGAVVVLGTVAYFVMRKK